MLVLTHWRAITNSFPINGISEVVDLARHDWKYLLSEYVQFVYVTTLFFPVDLVGYLQLIFLIISL